MERLGRHLHNHHVRTLYTGDVAFIFETHLPVRCFLRTSSSCHSLCRHSSMLLLRPAGHSYQALLHQIHQALQLAVFSFAGVAWSARGSCRSKCSARNDDRRAPSKSSRGSERERRPIQVYSIAPTVDSVIHPCEAVAMQVSLAASCRRSSLGRFTSPRRSGARRVLLIKSKFAL